MFCQSMRYRTVVTHTSFGQSDSSSPHVSSPLIAVCGTFLINKNPQNSCHTIGKDHNSSHKKSGEFYPTTQRCPQILPTASKPLFSVARGPPSIRLPGLRTFQRLFYLLQISLCFTILSNGVIKLASIVCFGSSRFSHSLIICDSNFNSHLD